MSWRHIFSHWTGDAINREGHRKARNKGTRPIDEINKLRREHFGEGSEYKRTPPDPSVGKKRK